MPETSLRTTALHGAILTLALLFRIRAVTADALGIPGTTQTNSGYDTEMGEDPMCWSSVASATPEGGIAFPNGALVKDFALADKVELLSSCPEGTWLEAFSPPEFADPDFRPRTLHWYNYTVAGRVDLSNLLGASIAADEGSKIAIAMLACDSLTAGFCSPFVHEQANIRLAREKEAKIAAGIPIPPAGPKIPGNRHGGTHVHSPAVVLDVPTIPYTSTGSELPAVAFDFKVEVPMIINEPGQFFMVGTLQFFTGDTPLTPFFRYDVANALKASERLVVYQEPAEILVVTQPILITSYVAIGISGAIILSLTILTIIHRNRQVMRISQVSFLTAFLFAALVATVSCFLLKPSSDLYCNLSHPLIVIPLHLFYSITLARLWRINAVVSPLLKNRLNSKRPKGFLLRFWCCESNHAIRQEISPAASFGIILVSCLPQIVLQAAAWLLQPQSKTFEYNESQSIGRCICDDGLGHGQSIRNYSLYLLLLLILVLLIMGHVARNLPSLLNESAEIYDTTLLSVFLAVLGGGVLAVTNAPTTSPDVAYMVKTFLVLTITVNSSLRIMMPKLRMVWSHQNIIVSKLVSDHRQSLMSTFSTYSQAYHSEAEVMTGSSAITPTGSKVSGLESYGDNDHSSEHDNPNTEDTTDSSTPEMAPTPKSSQDLWVQQVEDENKPGLEMEFEDVNVPLKESKEPAVRHVKFNPGEKNAKPSRNLTRKKKILIKQGEAPSKKVVLRMVDLQRELDHVTKQVMCGLNVEPQDWQAVRKLTKDLSVVFGNVEFDFEQDDGDEEQGGISKEQ